jgi:hypothetical protein
LFLFFYFLEGAAHAKTDKPYVDRFGFFLTIPTLCQASTMMFSPNTFDFGTVAVGGSVATKDILVSYSPDANHLGVSLHSFADGPFHVSLGSCPASLTERAISL